MSYGAIERVRAAENPRPDDQEEHCRQDAAVAGPKEKVFSEKLRMSFLVAAATSYEKKGRLLMFTCNEPNPWTKRHPPAASSFPSDRLKPKGSASNSSKGKSKGNEPTVSKSRRVRTLESLISDLQHGKQVKDPKGGCFCQARNHSLSPYNPMCPSCSLVLCFLNLPTHLCPSCSSPLVSSTPHLLKKIEEELVSVLDDEERQRLRELEERKRIQGAFPTLAASSPLQTSIPATGHPRKPTKAPSPGELKEIEDDRKRVEKPIGLSEVYYSSTTTSGWENLLLNERLTYVAPPTSPADFGGNGSQHKRKNKKKKKDPGNSSESQQNNPEVGTS
ncbi:hypothetical protein DL96DRAFT_1554965 [Flagelloscypha sp. PMI_526]|nr:hypothetical protein DL96DRAFT_1554965 [Flagelloscypha sp. PMI_526]